MCSPVTQNSCRDKFGLHDGLWFKVVKKSERGKILSNKLPLLLDKMATASGSEEYENLKKKVTDQKNDGKEVSPGDMYKLAALLARWRIKDRLPICLLCRKLDSKPEGLGHVIPHSVLKEAGQTKFFDHVRGAEGGVSNFGYYAFCKGCEQVFQQGEVYFNPQFFKPFLANVDDKIEKIVKNDRFPWLYHCLISIIWRVLCFIPENSTCICIQALEYLRNYLLNWETEPGEIDARVKLFLFAPNCKIQEMMKAENQEIYEGFFYNMFSGTIFCSEDPNLLTVWVFCGPLHVTMLYKGVNWSCDSFKDSLLTTETSKFTIKDKNTRIFPDCFYTTIVQFGKSRLSDFFRSLSAGKEANSTSETLVFQVTHLHLLPKDISYSRDQNEFRFSKDRFEQKGVYVRGAFTITEVERKGNKEKIVFVVIPNGLASGGEIAMGLNVNTDGTVQYMKDVKIPKNVVNADLSVPPFKEIIEELLKDSNLVG